MIATPKAHRTTAAADGDGAAAITLSDVGKVYGHGDGSVVALDGVSVAFPRGSFTAIMGPSGSGKSTFLHVAAGLDRPTSGSVALGGTDLAGVCGRRVTVLRRGGVGVIFHGLNLMPPPPAGAEIRPPPPLDGDP